MITVMNPGFYSTIQDLGRIGYQEYGVPLSGCMDRTSAKIANAMLNNEANSAVLEMIMTGPKITFGVSINICITGMECAPKVNDIPIAMNTAIFVTENDVLSIGQIKNGGRSYLAVSEGFLSPKILKSRSMYGQITPQTRLQKGDQLPVTANAIPLQVHAGIKRDIGYFSSQNLAAFQGPEFDQLSTKQQQLLATQVFTISKNNSRMAYQLEEPIPNTLAPIITSPVLPGTIQLTPSGKLIVLMRDCQITGGYPRVLQLKEEAIDILAQKGTKGTVRFQMDQES